MSGLRTARRGLAASTVFFAAFITAAAAEPRPFSGLVSPDPAETAAPADAGLTAACQASLRERFGRQPLTFARPRHTARDGTQIVRMDVTVAGQGLRAACSRDGAGGPVEAIVFDAPADDVGPRVIMLGSASAGTPAPTAAADRGYRFVARDPNAQPFDGSYPYPGHDGSYLSGVWGDPFIDGRRRFRRPGNDFVKGSPALETFRGTNMRFFDVPRGSSAPFASGGIASPAISNFTPKAGRGARVRSGGISSPGIGSFGR